jgi:hypothetical protein
LIELKEAYTAQNLQATPPVQLDGEAEEDVSKPSRTLHPAYQARHTRVGVWPLWDHASVKKEDFVISRIVQLLHPDHHDPSSGALVCRGKWEEKEKNRREFSKPSRISLVPSAAQWECGPTYTLCAAPYVCVRESRKKGRF